MRRLLALALLPLFAASAFAKMEDKDWSDLEKAFRAKFAQPGSADAKLDLVRSAAKDGEPRTWKIFADGLVLEATHLAKASEGLAKDLERLRVLLAKEAKYDAEETEMFALQKKVGEQEKERSGGDKVLRAIVLAAAGANEDGRKVILAAGRGHKEWVVRAAVARLAGSAPEDAMSKDVLADVFDKEKDPRVKMWALEALQTAPGNKWFPLVVARIADPDWSVQLMAVRVAGAREMGVAIPALIQALATCTPRLAEEIGKTLTKLTGQAMEPDAGAWSKWWEANRSKWGPDGKPLQPIVSVARPGDNNFYGIPIKTSSVLFIIDISGSMEEEKKGKVETPTTKPKGPITGEPAKPPPEEPEKFFGKKIEIAKQELRRAVKKLPKEAMFDIIAFNHNVTQWQPKMIPANDANKELAFAWIRDMTAMGSTFIDGALRMAFKMAGMGAYDHAYQGVTFDTIFLLSDGAPTDNGFPQSKDMLPDEILGHVAEWNAQHRVIINCIGIDNVVQGIEFMKKLAAQNGGVYVDG